MGLVAANALKSFRAFGVTRIKIDPFNPDRLYVATLNGHYWSAHAGESMAANRGIIACSYAQ